MRNRILLVLFCTIAAYGRQHPASQPVRSAAVKSIALLQATMQTWNSKQTCLSCHHQTLPLMVLETARSRGLEVNESMAHDAAVKPLAFLQHLDRAVQGTHTFDPPMDTGSSLLAAHSAGLAPNVVLAAYARLIANQQRPEGNWLTGDVRPPQADSAISATANGLRAMQFYLPASMSAENRERAGRTRQWLLSQKPQSAEDQASRLLGLAWAGAPAETLSRIAENVIAQQRADGGWAQLPHMASDAYATGKILSALNEAGTSPQHPAYARGIRYLLRTQLADGSWHVSTRLREQRLVSPPYFESGFPHKEDQMISCMATSWATAALLRSLPPVQTPKVPLPLQEITPAEPPRWVNVALLGSAAELQALLDAGLNPNSADADGESLLMLSALDQTKVNLLLERGADVNARSRSKATALLVAARYRGTAEVVRMLLDRGAQVNDPPGARPIFNASPLVFAAWAGDIDNVKQLLDRKAATDQMLLMGGILPISALLVASGQGDLTMTDYLLDHGVAIDQPDPNEGLTALGWAAVGNRLDIARTLIRHGANVNHIDKHGLTPAKHAALTSYGDTAMLQLLAPK